MTLPPVSRRDFLGASAGSTALLASGPLFAQADALPSRTVTVGIMGLKRGMEVAAALEKQPGVVIKYVCDVDSRRADAGKAKLEKTSIPTPRRSSPSTATRERSPWACSAITRSIT